MMYLLDGDGGQEQAKEDKSAVTGETEKNEPPDDDKVLITKHVKKPRS